MSFGGNLDARLNTEEIMAGEVVFSVNFARIGVFSMVEILCARRDTLFAIVSSLSKGVNKVDPSNSY